VKIVVTRNAPDRRIPDGSGFASQRPQGQVQIFDGFQFPNRQAAGTGDATFSLLWPVEC
jgi:hypothetical protein